jgi:YVTN family beta-propeller protein
VATPAIASRPFAVAISSAGVAFVGRQDVPFVQASTTTTAFADSVRVGQDPTDIAFTSNGAAAYVTNQFSGNVDVITVLANAVTDSVAIPGNPFRVVMGPGDVTIYVSSANDSVYAVNASSKAITARWGFNGPVNGLALAPNGAFLYVTTTAGEVGRVTLSSGGVDSVKTGATLQDVAVVGGTLFIANESGALQVRSASTLDSITTIPVAGAFGLRASPDGVLLVATFPASSAIAFIDPNTAQVITALFVGGTPRRVAFTADGTTALVTNEAGFVEVIR